MNNGQLSYEFSRAKVPTYHDGTQRVPWNKLSELCQWSWARDGRRYDHHV